MPTLSAEDKELYDELTSLLHGLQHTATHIFFHPEEAKEAAKGKSRKELVDKLRQSSRLFVEMFGCGNLCEDKNGGCVPCQSAVDGPIDKK